MGDASFLLEVVVLFDRGRRRGEMTIWVVGEALGYSRLALKGKFKLRYEVIGSYVRKYGDGHPIRHLERFAMTFFLECLS